LPEHELWVADVVHVSAEREKSIDPEGYLDGAPDIVIEMLSPSNSAAEMFDKEHLCLKNGAKEFWVVDPKRRLVKVSYAAGTWGLWRAGQEIPLPLFGGKTLAVDSIWA
jgi:Uma2 family endonuclease